MGAQPLHLSDLSLYLLWLLSPSAEADEGYWALCPPPPPSHRPALGRWIVWVQAPGAAVRGGLNPMPTLSPLEGLNPPHCATTGEGGGTATAKGAPLPPGLQGHHTGAAEGLPEPGGCALVIRGNSGRPSETSLLHSCPRPWSALSLRGGRGGGEGLLQDVWHPPPLTPSFRGPPAGPLEDTQCWGLTCSVAPPPRAPSRSPPPRPLARAPGAGSARLAGAGAGGAVVARGVQDAGPLRSARLAARGAGGLLSAVLGDEWKAVKETADTRSPERRAWVSQPEEQPDSWRRPGPVHAPARLPRENIKEN